MNSDSSRNHAAYLLPARSSYETETVNVRAFRSHGLNVEPNRYHAVCFVTTSSFVFIFVSFLLSGESSPSVSRGYTLAASLVLYGMYITEVFMSPSMKLLCLIPGSPNLLEFMKRVAMSPPMIHFNVSCWHFEPRKDSRSVEVGQYPYRVTSFTQDQIFKYNSWKDGGVDILQPASEANKVVLVDVAKTLHYIDYDTEQTAKDQSQQFQDGNRWRDDFLDFRVDLTIPNIPDRVVCFLGQHPAGWMNVWCYIAFSILLLSWPYRILLDYHTLYMRYDVAKMISVHQDNYHGGASVSIFQ